MLEDVTRAIQRDVETRDAGVGGGQVRVVGRPDGHGWHRLEALLRRGQSGRSRPEVYLWITLFNQIAWILLATLCLYFYISLEQFCSI